MYRIKMKNIDGKATPIYVFQNPTEMLDLWRPVHGGLPDAMYFRLLERNMLNRSSIEPVQRIENPHFQFVGPRILPESEGLLRDFLAEYIWKWGPPTSQISGILQESLVDFFDFGLLNYERRLHDGVMSGPWPTPGNQGYKFALRDHLIQVIPRRLEKRPDILEDFVSSRLL